MNLTYASLEKLFVKKPVDRITYISESCVGKTVLDIGCYDETALVKRDTEHWLHGRIAARAKHVDGIDNSTQNPCRWPSHGYEFDDLSWKRLALRRSRGRTTSL